MNERLKISSSEEEKKSQINEEFKTQTVLERLLGHLILSRESFRGVSARYLQVASLIIISLLATFRFLNINALINNFVLEGEIGEEWERFRETSLVGQIFADVLGLFVFGTIIFSLMIFFKGKGKYLRSIGIYAIAQIPMVVGYAILLIVALNQPAITAPGNETYIYYMLKLSEADLRGYALTKLILVNIIASFYMSLIAGAGMAAEHKIPTLMGIILALIVYITRILFGIFFGLF